MADTVTAADYLAELRRLHAAATAGEWKASSGGTYNMGRYVLNEYFVCLSDDDVSIAADILDPVAGKPSKENADFIAAAHNALPRLLAEIERLTAEVAQLKARPNEH